MNNTLTKKEREHVGRVKELGRVTNEIRHKEKLTWH